MERKIVTKASNATDVALSGINETSNFFNVFDEAPALVAICRGKDFVYVYANPFYLKSINRDLDIIGKPVLEVFPELKSQEIYSVLKSVFKSGEPFVGNEMPIRMQDGKKQKEYYFNFVYQPYKDQNGNVEGVLTHAVDVTQQVHSRKKIENSEARYRAMFEQSHDAVQLVSPSGKVLYSSESIENVLGYKPSEIQDVDFLPYLHPDDSAEFLKQWTKLQNKPHSVKTLQYRVLHKDGSWVLLETTLTNHLQTPNVNAILGNFRNITEHKEAEQSLESQTLLMKTIANNATLGLIMMNEDQICTYLNPAAEKIIGYSLKTIQKLNKPLHDIIHHMRPDGTHYPTMECPIDRALPQQNQTKGEDIFVRSDGSFYPVSFTASPIVTDGKPIGTVIELKDTTEEKAASAEHERLVLIENQRNELIQLNRAKDEFIALASHQLRTPATAVKQYISIVLDGYMGEVTDDQKQFLQTAYNNNERQLTIINDLLKTAQLDSNSYVLKKRRQDLVELMRSVITEMRSTLILKNQAVSFKVQSDKVMAKVDATELKLVFINLLENASKYSHPDKKIHIKIETKDDFAYISFKDSGVGILPEDNERIFEKFTRINNELSDTVTGTGLGLYWVKQIIEMHAGTIEVTSRLGEGSTFKIRLPL